MGMNIKEKYDISFIAYNFLLQIIDLWVKSFTWKNPLPVNVISRNIRSIVSADNSIYIDHRDYFKLKLLS